MNNGLGTATIYDFLLVELYEKICRGINKRTN